MAFKKSNLEELIIPLRVQIGDIETTPTYSDELLHLILRQAVAALMTRWHDKYYVTNEGVICRNPNELWDWSSPPVIQHKDRRAIILQSSITIKGGKKFSESSNAVTWKDEEISYSNVQSAKQISSTLGDDVKELNELFPVKLARSKYSRQYGWNNDW